MYIQLHGDESPSDIPKYGSEDSIQTMFAQP